MSLLNSKLALHPLAASWDYITPAQQLVIGRENALLLHLLYKAETKCMELTIVLESTPTCSEISCGSTAAHVWYMLSTIVVQPRRGACIYRMRKLTEFCLHLRATTHGNKRSISGRPVLSLPNRKSCRRGCVLCTGPKFSGDQPLASSSLIAKLC